MNFTEFHSNFSNLNSHEKKSHFVIRMKKLLQSSGRKRKRTLFSSRALVVCEIPDRRLGGRRLIFKLDNLYLRNASSSSRTKAEKVLHKRKKLESEINWQSNRESNDDFSH